MNTTSSIAASVLALGALGSAHALDLGDLTNKAMPIGIVHGVGSFTDLYTFSITGPGVAVGAVVSAPVDIPQLPGIEYNFAISSVSLTGPGVSVTDSDGSNGFSVLGTLLGAGNYTFAVAGKADGTFGGAYGGIVQTSLSSLVVEPQTLALMLAGLGAVGWVARRRQQG